MPTPTYCSESATSATAATSATLQPPLCVAPQEKAAQHVHRQAATSATQLLQQLPALGSYQRTIAGCLRPKGMAPQAGVPPGGHGFHVAGRSRTDRIGGTPPRGTTRIQRRYSYIAIQYILCWPTDIRGSKKRNLHRTGLHPAGPDTGGLDRYTGYSEQNMHHSGAVRTRTAAQNMQPYVYGKGLNYGIQDRKRFRTMPRYSTRRTTPCHPQRRESAGRTVQQGGPTTVKRSLL